MKKSTLILLTITLNILCYGQSTETKYYKNAWLDKEVKKEKAKFSQTIIQKEDGTKTFEIREINKNEIFRSETYKGDEPYGVWKIRYGKEYTFIDYNFPLIYSDNKCKDTLPIRISDYSQDNDSLGYKAPKIQSGELTIFQFIAKNLIYPQRAVDEGIQGKVYVQMTLSKEGIFEEIVIKRGANILLDKEAVRILRQLKFSSPPTINGKAYSLNCLVLPITYHLN
jgi:TonB family protein